jgi:hypothetical protein
MTTRAESATARSTCRSTKKCPWRQRFPAISGDRIEATRAPPRVTTQQPLESHPAPNQHTVARDCLFCVSGTGRFETTVPAEDRRQKSAVYAEKTERQPHEHAIAGRENLSCARIRPKAGHAALRRARHKKASLPRASQSRLGPLRTGALGDAVGGILVVDVSSGFG